MKKKRFSEEQIIAVLKEAEAGAKVLDLCRKHGISGCDVAGCGDAVLRRFQPLDGRGMNREPTSLHKRLKPIPPRTRPDRFSSMSRSRCRQQGID